MKKSNIVLGILAGAAIGGAVALILKARKELDEIADGIDEEEEDDDEPRPESRFENIARQFSERISDELKSAENRIRSAVKKGSSSFNVSDGEYGTFL